MPLRRKGGIVVIDFKMIDNLAQRRGFSLQIMNRGSRFFNHGRVFLGYDIHLIHGRIYFVQSSGLLLR